MAPAAYTETPSGGAASAKMLSVFWQRYQRCELTGPLVESGGVWLDCIFSGTGEQAPGFDRPGGDSHRADIVLRVFDGNRLRQLDNRPLGRVIGRASRSNHAAELRGNIYDLAAWKVFYLGL